MVPFLVVLTIVAFVVVDLIVQAVARRRQAVHQPSLQTAQVHLFHWKIDVPAGYFVSTGHSWGRVEPDGAVVAGMDEFARQMLGTPDTLEMPRIGTAVKAGEPIATLYRKGRLARVPAPVDGVVEDVHTQLILHPETLSKDAYKDGWMVRLRPQNLGRALTSLRVAEDASRFQESELDRMRGFLKAYPMTGVAADGGTPVEGIVEVLGTRAWDEFRRDFLRETI
jgi:glycine cleavage system H protein